MLDKLNRNKIYLVLIACLVFSCSRPIYNTEIFCSDNSSILVKFATAEEVKRAVRKYYEEHIAKGYKMKNTVFRLKDGRSFMIENIPPEVMIKCSFRQTLYGEVDKSYIHHF